MASYPSDAPARVVQSAPDGDTQTASGWTAKVYNDGNAAFSFYVWVICADVWS